MPDYDLSRGEDRLSYPLLSETMDTLSMDASTLSTMLIMEPLTKDALGPLVIMARNLALALENLRDQLP